MSQTYVQFQGVVDADNMDVPADAPLRDKVVAALRGIYDPELPVNIYDLGLIYRLDIQGQDVILEMTLTTPHCPVADSMPGQVKSTLEQVNGTGKVDVTLTWDPPWSVDLLSDEVKLQLGLL